MQVNSKAGPPRVRPDERKTLDGLAEKPDFTGKCDDGLRLEA
jgi:hypothetical protein